VDVRRAGSFRFASAPKLSEMKRNFGQADRWGAKPESAADEMNLQRM